ncbi:MAG TPA: hypothetical protein VEI97_03385, partial [bacterium]|nr:hypothetical protein [bacterium]
GGAPLSAGGAPSVVPAAFFVKLDPSGMHIWSRKIDNDAGATTERGTGVAVDPAGNIYALVEFASATVDAGGGPLPYTGGTDVAVIRLNANGTYGGWQRSFGSSSGEAGVGIATNGTLVAVSGTYVGNNAPTNFGTPQSPVVTPTTPATQGYVVTYNATNGTPQWLYSFGATSSEGVNAVAVDGASNVYAAVRFGNNTDFQDGAGPIVLSPVGGRFTALKLTSTGTVAWVRWFNPTSGALSDLANDVKLDPAGALRFAGDFNNTGYDFDPGPGTWPYSTAGSTDAIAMKLQAADGLW